MMQLTANSKGATALNLPYSVTGNTISVLSQGRMRVLDRSSINFIPLSEALRKPTHDLDLINDLVDVGRFVARASFGAVQIGDDAVRWNGVKVHNVVADRLLDLLRAGHDMTPLANFLDRLMKNPLESARNELYLWLEAGNAPITPDGYFLAFKAVRPNYTDKRTGRMDNSVGATVSMPREEVDPDRARECSTGLHFCSHGYLQHFASIGDPIMILQIEPADVVAIPRDYNNQKGRAWTYDVIGEVPQDETARFFDGHPLVQPYEAPVVAEPVVPTPGVAFASASDVKVGMRVVVLNDDAHWDLKIGAVGEVVDIDDGDDTIEVHLDGGGDSWGAVSSFAPEPIVAPVPKPAPGPAFTSLGDISVGDRVVVVCLDDSGVWDLALGAVGEVSEIDDSDDTIEVDFDGGTEGDAWGPFGCFALEVAAQPAPTPIAEEAEADDAPVPEATRGKPELMFTHGKRSFMASEVLSLVTEHGQRGASRLTDVPRTTLQEWLKAINAQGEG